MLLFFLFHFTYLSFHKAISSWKIILFNFLQVWDLMLVGFLFFQTFKYVRMPKIFICKGNTKPKNISNIWGLIYLEFYL